MRSLGFLGFGGLRSAQGLFQNVHDISICLILSHSVSMAPESSSRLATELVYLSCSAVSMPHQCTRISAAKEDYCQLLLLIHIGAQVHLSV